MRVIIHDLTPTELGELNLSPSGENESTDTAFVSDDGTIRNCIGCFGCWVKTPGTCVLKDGYHEMGKLLSQCDEMVIISKCMYGSFTPFIRNVLDRCIPYLLPYFTKVWGETHHRDRYPNRMSFTAHFYGEDITAEEVETAKALLIANGENFYSIKNETRFHKNLAALKEALQ